MTEKDSKKKAACVAWEHLQRTDGCVSFNRLVQKSVLPALL